MKTIDLAKPLIIALSLLASGCVMHKVNNNPVPQVQSLSSFTINIVQDELKQSWWKSFERDHLNALVDESLNHNWNIAEAVAVLEQSKALARQTKSTALPQLDIESSASRLSGNQLTQQSEADFGLRLDWEVDVWRKISSAAKADKLEAQANLNDIDAIKLSLSAQVSEAYFAAVAAHEQLNLLKSQLKLDKELESILQLRLDNGIGFNVELFQQQARVADSETLIPLAELDLAIYENRLDVLVGQHPDGQRRVSASDSLVFSAQMPKIGVPAQLLLNRPDLISAKYELMAADADIASAIANRLPTITLNGSSFLLDTDDFTSPVSAIVAEFVQPLIDWGNRKAEVKINKEIYKARLAAYTQLYLEAVEDVENALIQEIKQREFLVKLDIQRQLLSKAVQAAELRFQQGVDDYQPVLNALQELRAIERNLVSEKLALINIRISLFRAIGGPIYDA